ncbi:MAG: Carbamoyltransferase HypF [Pelotomaculum sp. PtaB.Bin013]|nr:MAG: Carbamoyltransferase HypF [Pelotomaculum sp. PtaB.Bin013]
MTRQVQPGGKTVSRYRIVIKGVVQGVGFRPFVYNLAQVWGVKGSVLNSSRGVVIEAEAEENNVAGFLSELKNNPPQLSRISDYQLSKMPPAGYTSFVILASDPGDEKEALVPPDVAICADCAKEIIDRKDRHYQYPFTNCTNCGPRFTIINEIPYDRPKTSMASFSMCDQCAREYHDPADRRFHAQPTACPVCGPHVEVLDSAGRNVAGKENWLETCWNILQDGKILALKGLGGYHLACDAKNKEAVKALRRRKGRDAKPFAVMCRDLETVQKYCVAGEKEIELLISPLAPIIILRKHLQTRLNEGLPEELAPGLKTLGVMLPYTPLHLLLFSGPLDMLVMTSGNYSNLPLVKDNSRAAGELGGIADYFLQHNREIVNRCDDSLIQVVDGEPHIYRRSRGYVPHPVLVPRGEDEPVILGIGGEMKNNFCLLKKNQAFMSQYIGEIDSLEGEENLLTSFFNLRKLTDAIPEVVAYDAHPGYASARVARQIPARAYFEVQHHHAHLASCLAENGLGNEEVIGAILDGTGYGTDGNLWGFEILTGNYDDFQRRFHLAYVPLPGGEAAIRQPWRTAVAYLLAFLGEEGKRSAGLIFPEKNLDVIERMVAGGFNSPLSSGCGRLFDAVSALLGICRENTYEGQAAVELGEAIQETAGNDDMQTYPYETREGIIWPGQMLAAIIDDKMAGVPVQSISARFHRTLVSMVGEAVERVSGATGIKKVALSGGTWQNQYLFRTAKQYFSARGFEVLYHRQVPANDGGIALGQAMIAHWRWRKRCV